jgi:hypothetical protein
MPTVPDYPVNVEASLDRPSGPERSSIVDGGSVAGATPAGRRQGAKDLGPRVGHLRSALELGDRVES